jgi:dipeptidyl aminopeptidase/acylaminoacyl peptidase
MLKPPDFTPSKRYPVLVYIYGEPAGQTVEDRWGGPATLYHRYLASLGYLVVSFDNAGTPAPRGRAWRKAVYGAVGVLSSKQQAAALRWLGAQRSYVDLDRVAVWGWSGGGTNTLNLVFRSPDLYKVGMAVAPVPDQRLYDTIAGTVHRTTREQRGGLQAGVGDQLRRGLERRSADRARLGRRQCPLPGIGTAGEPPDRARQAVRFHDPTRIGRTRSPRDRARRRTCITC